MDDVLVCTVGHGEGGSLLSEGIALGSESAVESTVICLTKDGLEPHCDDGETGIGDGESLDTQPAPSVDENASHTLGRQECRTTSESIFTSFNPGLTSQDAARKFVPPLTDHGNAQLFVRLFPGMVRYVRELGIFIVWDGSRWLRTDMGGKTALMRLVKRFIYTRYSDAKSKKTLFTMNGEVVSPKDALAGAKRAAASGRIKAMLDFIKDMPGVSVSQSELDANPLLLGVANGVLDFQTCTLIKNTPEFLITRYARAAYRSESETPEFIKFISQVCKGRKDLIDYLQEVLGYALSGLTKEQAFYILLGTGANGKSTLIETFFHLLGDYAKGLPAHAFIKSESRAIRNDFARLTGVRFASCAEVNTGKSLDESAVKRMTGGDVITARFIGKEFFDFHVAAKFFFSVNTLPRVTGADNGIYRRLVVIPFDADFSESMDKELREKLLAEIDGILTWAVRGFQRWNKRGFLVKPSCVEEACKAYRAEMDTVQSFLDDVCKVDSEGSTPLGALYEEYKQWAKAAHVNPANMHLFGTLMGQKGFSKVKSGSWRWKGVTLKATNVFGVPAAPATTAPDSSSTGLAQ